MKAEQLRSQSSDELQQHLLDLLKEQFSLRMQKGAGEMPRVHQFKRVRREIARVKTIINQQEKATHE